MLTLAVPATGNDQVVAGEAAAARVLAETGVPAARLTAGPAEIAGWWVTAWADLDLAEATPVAATDIGALAAALHRATAGPDRARWPGLVATDPLAAVHVQITTAAAHVRSDDRAWVSDAARRLRPVWRAAAAGPGAVIHGDLHAANVVRAPGGPTLVDLELTGWGPVAYDAAPTVAAVRHYGRPESDLDDFDRAYGAPLARTEVAAELAAVWALWSTAWAVANAHRSARLAEEAAVRLETLRTGVLPRPWLLS